MYLNWRFSFKTKILLSISIIFILGVSLLVGAYIYINNKFVSQEIEALSGATITLEKVNEIRIKSYKSIMILFLIALAQFSL